MLDSECMGHLHYYYASRLVQVAENISNSNYSYRQKIKLIDKLVNYGLSKTSVYNAKPLSKIIGTLLTPFKVNSSLGVYYSTKVISKFQKKYEKTFFQLKRNITKV